LERHTALTYINTDKKPSLTWHSSNPQASLTRERVTMRCSNLFSLDDYIKEYLESHPELSIDTQLKIILRELLTRNIIVQLQEFMSHVGIVSFFKPIIK